MVIGHHLSSAAAVWFPPLVTLARLAAEVGGMTIGARMPVLPLFNPVHVAEQAAPLVEAVTLIGQLWPKDTWTLPGATFR